MAGIGGWLGPWARGLMAVACFGLGIGCDAADHNPGSGQGGTAGSGGGSAAGSPDGGDETSSDAGNGVGGTAGSVTDGGVGGGAGAAGADEGPSSTKLSAAEAMMLFEQSPHCVGPTSEFRLEGNVDGKVVDDVRYEGNLNGGYANGVDGSFDSPLGPFRLDPGEVELHFKWTILLAFGDASTMSRGVLVSPATSEPLCITSGVLGFVESGAEAQGLKFRIDGARAGADCSGEPVALELRGCMN